MELELEKSKLIEEIEKTLKSSEEDYQKALAVYVKKLGAYVEYVAERARLHQPLGKEQPYFSRWGTQALTDALSGLKAHMGNTVKLDSHEYADLKRGIESVRAAGRSSLSALESYQA